MFARNRQGGAAQPSADPVAGAGHEALRFLTQQGLEHTPVNFAVAWRTRVDRCGLTAMAVDAILLEGRALTQADVERITLAEAARAIQPAASSDPRQDALRHQTLRLADLAADAASQSQEFGRDLSGDLIELMGDARPAHETVRAMIERTRGVEERLRAASQEIEDLRQQVETVRDDALHDTLTTLLNRRGALHELCMRDPAAPGWVALCDVDHFKSINDRFGHGVGDRVLKGVAGSLAASFGDYPVARWGGEEFLVILDGIAPAAATGMLDTARRDLAARTFRLRDTNEPIGTVTMSVGLARFVGRDAGDAIEAADRMLYIAKGSGRNRVVADGDEAAR